MKLSGLFDWMTGRAAKQERAERNEQARGELKANAEKALDMKKGAGGPNIPPHPRGHAAVE